ncbi:MAG: carboxylate-amine ligase [Candidatus Promineifilaceae bacterium]|nr:carboxylate-amine ligase [Candidatus Promineifilaceae bacterium]
MRRPSLTIGIEEEYQIVDPQTGELRSYITQSLEEDHRVLREFDVEAKTGQSVVEIGTRVCRTAAEAKAELIRIRRGVADLATRNNLRIVAAGTHPFAQPKNDEENQPGDSYLGVKPEMRYLAQRHHIFSTHIHITIEDREFLIDAMNVSRYLLPHVLALSASSPFRAGQDTGFKSYRSLYLRNFPRTGIPRIYAAWGDYTDMVDTLIRTNCVPDGHNIWWDVRPHWEFPTLEFRICDVCTKVDEAVAVAALFQAIVAKLWKLRYDNMTFRTYPADLIEENKWRAVRHGLDGHLIDFGKKQELPARKLITELVDWFVDDVVDELGCRQEVAYAHRIMDEGTSADRQQQTFKETGSLRRVVKQLIDETNELPD